MNVISALPKWARATPEAPAVACGTRIVSNYEQLLLRVQALANAILGAGYRRGDHVAIVMPNRVEYIETMLAIWYAGLVCVPVNAKLHRREIAYIIDHADVSLCFMAPGCDLPESADTVRYVDVTGGEYQRWIAPSSSLPEATPPALDGDDLAWLFYTSGTTGRPKGAMISHRNLLSMCLCYFRDVDPEPPWRHILHAAPLSHGSGLYGLAYLLAGGCQVVPESGRFDVAEIAQLCRHWNDIVFFAAPTMVRRLQALPGDDALTGLKTVLYGGAPMYLEDVREFVDRFGPRLAQLYGQGESPMTITALPRSWYQQTTSPHWAGWVASAGLPQSAVSVRVADVHGHNCAQDTVGEVLVRGDTVVSGYWNADDATRTALRDGWLWTGDLGSFDRFGMLTLKDRSKDLIISGGSNIYPREVEEVLLQHAAVAEVSVVGVDDAEWGELVAAYIVAVPEWESTLSQTALEQLCLASLARFKRPRVYRLVDSLPKNNYGKVLKTSLRQTSDFSSRPLPE